ncbi:GNAT family N-acetyltransferase [Hespellia stercorisuis]|uniref:Predicted acetyltransferase n=1 Tax=Hespellia stercorisuis DSM 15480 TaxID=1121950 RepID=A0A1M6V2S6_9FIRM|nr:GNAT family N-acetyltransferase [Hespellia stercorisuis]SHK75724.1 Predicted acetyltransferase [Hespellia stercorisuis DSM 15480]
MNKKKLKMQLVSSEYMEQYNALLRYVFQVTDQELHSVGWQEKEIIRAKFPTMEKADVIGWFDNDTLVSQVAVYPMQVQIFGKKYSMGGLTGVGTYPEYSNMGLMHKLLEQALTNMRKKEQYICYLYPYSIPYYRRKGWELISDKISYEIKDYQLPKNRQVSGSVQRVKTDSEELKKTYDRYAAHTHGAIIRDELAWNEYWLWDKDDIMAAIYYNEANEPDGYIIYWIENEVFYIKDMIFNNEEARTGLWNFVSAHFSMIDHVEGNIYTDEPLAFLLEDASIKEVISPYYMARIVDFPAFVKNYPFKADEMEREWRFSMTDPIMECNQGSFLLKITKDGHGEAVKIPEQCPDKISIQTMTTMLMGYKRPDYLARIGRIQADGETIDMLEDAIEQQTPYISDYF